MRKILLPLTSIVIIASCFYSCSGGGVESKIKAYVQDSIVPKLNDPSSFQLVSIAKPDTVMKNKMLAIDVEFDSTMYEIQQKGIKVADTTLGDDLKKYYYEYKARSDSFKTLMENTKAEMNKPDRVIGYRSMVSFRAKNAMGALMLTETQVTYYPGDDSTKEHFTHSPIKAAGTE